LYEGGSGGTAENFTVTISGPTVTGGATQTVSITDNETTAPSVSLTDSTTKTVSEGVGNYVFSVTLSAASGVATVVTVNTTNGTATSGSDYTAVSAGTITIPAGSTTGTINIPITDDTDYEGSTAENFTVTISGPTITGGATQTVSITDNDTAPTLSLSATTYSGAEGNTITVTINKTGASLVASTVNLATAITGTGVTHAISGTDYTAVNQSVNIPASAGNSTVTFDLSTIQDTLYENSETFTVSISSPTNATLTGTTSATVTITNDDTAPTASLTAGTTNSVGEGAGNYVFSVSLNAASGVDTVITVNTTAGTATAGGTDFGTLTNATITIPAGSTTGTINIPITDDATYEGNETFTVTISGPTITGGATQTVTINDNDLGIASATTMDSDNDGKIDGYKIVFSEAVNDNTFPGYSANANGSAQTSWLIAGYTGLVLSNGTAAPVADTLNDDTIYLRFTEGSSGDTGAKPDLTTTASPGLTGTSGSTLPQVATLTITEQDGAKAVIMSAVGTEGSNSLVVTFSEAIYTTTGVPACNTAADITVADTTFTDGNTSGATSFTALSEACGTDNIITYTTNNNLVIGDTADSISYSGGTVFDAANNQVATTAKTFTVNANTIPALTLLEELDTDYDGKIDTLQLTFDKNMSDATISANLSQCTVGGFAVTAFNTGTTANDSQVKLTVSTSVATGTDFKTAIYTAGSWQSASGGNLASFSYSAHNGSGVPRDVAAPVITDATATDATNDYLTLTFSEDIDATIRGNITTANVGNYFNLKNGSASSVSMPTVNAVSWTSNKVLKITFTGDVSSTLTDGSTVTLNSTTKIMDAASNFYASTATINSSFTTDTTAPYLSLVTDITSASNYSGSTGVSTILVKFSEAVKSDAGVNSGNLAANYNLTLSTGGSAGVTISSITVVSADTYQLVLSGRLTSGTEYLLKADDGTIDANAIKDLASNNLSSPNSLTFIANDVLRVLSADATSGTSIKLGLSKLLDSTSVVCATTSACAAKYFINPSLGGISSATMSSNTITLTLDGTVTMKAMSYTIVVANGVSSDDPSGASGTFDTGSTDAIKDSTTTVSLSGNPFDRITFQGKGTSVNTFSSGWYMEDPFADGSKFSFTFNYGSKVFVGPNEYNNATLRFDASGKNVVSNTFKFKSNSWKSVSLNCSTTAGFGYGFDGSNNSSCDKDGAGTGYSGALYEEGMVGFTSLTMTSGSLLTMGPMINNASNAYFTQDKDNQLDTSIFALRSFTGGGNTKSIQAYFADGDNIYMGHASNHGTQAPILVRMPVTFTSGVVTNIADANNNSDNLNLDATPVGKPTGTGGGWVNSADAIGVDSFIAVTLNSQTKRIYIGNSVGIASSINTDTFASAVASQPSNMATSGQTNLVLPGIKNSGSFPEGLLKVSPGQRGVPFLKFHNSKLYAARNVSLNSSHTNGAITEGNKTQNYAEVYVCSTPSGGSGSNKYCTGADWVLLFTTQSSASGSTRLDSTKSDNKAISMFEITPAGVVYLGFDSPSGFRIYRATASGADLPNGTGWTQQGTDGMGTCATGCYTHIQSSAVVQDGTSTTYYTYITAGKHDSTNLWSVPIKVYRQADVGTNVIVGSIFNLKNFEGANLLAFISKTRNNVSFMLLIGIVFVAVTGIGLRRKYLKDHHLS
jgi:hypothetical protein